VKAQLPFPLLVTDAGVGRKLGLVESPCLQQEMVSEADNLPLQPAIVQSQFLPSEEVRKQAWELEEDTLQVQLETAQEQYPLLVEAGESK
jgi:hypothetical protein